jgi:ATP-binding cassette, subfamily B, bacterial
MSIFNRIFTTNTPNKSDQKPPTFRENVQALKLIPQFLKLIWQTHKSYTLFNIFLRIIKSVLPLAMLYVGKLIIDEVLILRTTPNSWNTLYLWIGIELGLALFSDLLARIITLIDALLGDLFANKSSIELMQHAAFLDLQQFENATFYDKLERARRQTNGRVVLMTQVLAQVQDLISIVFLAVGLATFNAWLMLLLIVVVIPSFLSENYYNSYTYSIARSWTPERRELDYLRYIGASDETAKEIKIFGLSDFVIQRFKFLSDKYFLANRNVAVKRAFWGSVFSIIGTVGYYGAYVYIIYATVSGKLGLGDLTFLSGSFSRLSSLLQGILSRFSSIAQNALYLQDWFEFFALKPNIITLKAPESVPSIVKTGFIFENVGFKYPNSEKWAVRHLNFTLNANEKLALVGENGAGKTTIVKLIARLYEPNEGKILLDGKDLKEYSLNELQAMIGVIFQDFVKFQFDISDNIAVGKIDLRADKPRIESAASKSLANQVVEQFEKGYQQLLGKRFDKGAELSGGQWQKIALARAYMRDAQLIVLDEPTAALDARAEYEVFQRFAELSQDKMAILISHRFSTVRMADRILVLKNGEIVESGTHNELLALNGLYAELFALQAQGYK